MALTTNSTKMASPDRIFKFSVIDGTKPKTAFGMVDPRIFTGSNCLHVKKDPETNFWFFEYEQGGLPQPLKCKFTGFKAALRKAEEYFGSRNIKIDEVE